METSKMQLKKYWISWWQVNKYGSFEIHFPWWISGYRNDNESSIVCALKAESESDAKEIIYKSYDTRPKNIEFRFCNEKDDTWSPYSSRFQKVEWMENYWS